MTICNCFIAQSCDVREKPDISKIYKDPRQRSIDETSHAVDGFATSEKNQTCSLTFDEADVSMLFKLAQDKYINIVYLQPKFPSSSESTQMVRKWQWVWVGKIGHEIISALAMTNFSSTSTLTVGTKTVSVRVSDNPQGCITQKKDMLDFMAGEMLLRFENTNIERKLCYNDSSSSHTHICCQVISENSSRKYQCSAISESRFTSALKFSSSFMLPFFFTVFGIFLFIYLLIFSPSLPENRISRAGYHELTYSPLSIYSICLMLLWEEYGSFKSFARRVLVIVVIYFLLEDTWYINIFYVWVGLFLFPILQPVDPAQVVPNYNKDLEDSFAYTFSEILSSFLSFEMQDIHTECCRHNYLGAINLITLPFNITRWIKALLKLYERMIPCERFNRETLNNIGNCVLHFLFVVVSLLFIVIVLIFQVCIIILTILKFWYILIKTPFYISDSVNKKVDRAKLNVKDKKVENKTKDTSCLGRFFLGVLHFFSLHFTGILFIVAMNNLAFLVLSWSTGLVLNIFYYFPYITFGSVLLFYSWHCWKYIEEQYLTLKYLIYEECRDSLDNKNRVVATVEDRVGNAGEVESYVVCIGPAVNELEENNDKIKVVPVVSKQLYENVRENLLPYHWNLFIFWWKLVAIFVFAFSVLTLVEILQENDTLPTIKILTTFCVGAFPHLMNMLVAKNSEEHDNAWKEELRVRVKRLVYKVTAKKKKSKLLITCVRCRQNHGSQAWIPFSTFNTIHNI